MADYIYNETRYKMLTKFRPDEAKRLAALAEQDAAGRWRLYQHLAAMDYAKQEEPATGSKEPVPTGR